MIELIATAESIKQAESLIDRGIDTLYIGEDLFGLRLPASFTREELTQITQYAHEQGKQVAVAVNAIMHNDRISQVLEYLQFLESIKVDRITVGDPGVIHLLQKHEVALPYVYDAQTMVTSSRLVNFWEKRGASGAVLSRELTYEELASIGAQAKLPTEVLVYGATCIHQSKRPVVENYFNFTNGDQPDSKALFLSEAKKVDTHYSIYEDLNGTHVFATNDINLLPELDKLVAADLKQWKLDGLFTQGEAFVEIASLFIEAKEAIHDGKLTPALLEKLNEQLEQHHPKTRGLDQGFFVKDPNDVK